MNAHPRRAPAPPVLARTQSQPGRRRASPRPPACRTELVLIRTEGDVSPEPLAQMGGTGVFVSALRDALLRGEVDLAVHSLKDLPTGPADGHRPGRRARRARTPATSWSPVTASPSASCPQGARVGTGAPRRVAQIARARPRRRPGRGPRQRRHPDRQGPLRRARRRRPRPRRPGPARPGRRGHRGARPAAGAARPPAREPSRWSAAPTTRPRRDAVRRRPRRPAHPRLRRGRARAARRARGGVLRAGRRPGRSCQKGTSVTNCGSVRSRSRSTAALSVRRSASGPLDDPVGLGRTLAAEMLAEGAADLIPRPDAAPHHSHPQTTEVARRR